MPMLRSRGGTCTPCSGAATSSPPIEIEPAVGCSRPAMQRSVVVLPQPEGPSSTTISPAAMRKLTSSTAGRPTRNCLRRCETISSATLRILGKTCHALVTAVPVGLVPFVEPGLLQRDELLVVRDPHLHDFRIEALRIERRLLQRSEIADFLDHDRLPLFGEAPVEEQPRGVRVGGGLRNAGRERRHRRALRREEDLHRRAVAQFWEYRVVEQRRDQDLAAHQRVRRRRIGGKQHRLRGGLLLPVILGHHLALEHRARPGRAARRRDHVADLLRAR